MTEAELLVLKDGLKLLDDALSNLSSIQNQHVAAIVNIVHGAVKFGEKLLDA